MIYKGMVCQWCGATFTAQKSSTRYCSKRCAEHANKQRMRELNQYLIEKYEARIAELEHAKKERRTTIISTIHDYTTYIMAEFFTKEELETLHENIEALAYGQQELYKPIRSREDNPIKSPALRHFAWNIGERLDIPLIDRAKFIKEIFPHELGNATIEYLSKNLRDSVTSKIKIDVPENGDYRFDCMRNFADGKISSY